MSSRSSAHTDDTVYPGYWDSRYLKNEEGLSKPVFGVREKREVFVTMRDGVRICVDIFLPDDNKTKFPALFATSAYARNMQSLNIPPQPHDSYMFNHELEAGDVNFFVKRGYAYVIGESRGIGKSEGQWHGIYSTKEQEDCYDVIEWIAAQEWCNGKVGMMGLSYFGGIQRITATLQPPHLSAIFPVEAWRSPFDYVSPGGIIMSRLWGLENAFPAHDSVIESEALYGKEEVMRRLKILENDPDIKNNPHYFSVLDDLKKHSAFADFMLNRTVGPFWEKRSMRNKYDRVKIPVYEGGVWSGYAFTIGAFESFESLNVPKKISIFGWRNFFSLPFTDLNYEALRWYDHWLKGIDTGIMEEPPIRLFISGINKYRYENEWPLARTKWTRFYLHPFGALDLEPVRTDGVEPDGLVHVPPTISNTTQSLVYSTPPVYQPMEITGPIALHIYASIDQEDANFISHIFDLSPDGQRLYIESGYLRASHRDLDMEKSKPWAPYLSHASIHLVTPGEIVEYAIPIAPISHVFLPNHRMQLEITTMDSMPIPRGEYVRRMELIGHLPSSKVTFYKISRDPQHQSHLIVPLIAESNQVQYVKPEYFDYFGKAAGKSFR